MRAMIDGAAEAQPLYTTAPETQVLKSDATVGMSPNCCRNALLSWAEDESDAAAETAPL
jgi:hypothetical protein